MKKENKTQKTEFSIGKINRIISKIHKINIKPYYEGKEIFNELDDGIKI